MLAYAILFTAIAFEVVGTLLLPITQQFTRVIPSIVVIVSYSVSFYCLSLITNKLPLAIIYVSWAGLGIFFVSLVSYFFYSQSLNWQSIMGLCFIIFGISLVNIYKTH